MSLSNKDFSIDQNVPAFPRLWDNWLYWILVWIIILFSDIVFYKHLWCVYFCSDDAALCTRIQIIFLYKTFNRLWNSFFLYFISTHSVLGMSLRQDFSSFFVNAVKCEDLSFSCHFSGVLPFFFQKYKSIFKRL